MSLRYIHFCWIFGYAEKQLDKKQVNLKIYDWIANNYNTDISRNISRSKGNQAIEYGQLIECNVRNITQKITQKMRWGD